ncbi:DUF2441 domain-containing protein [Psychrobacter pocilloporae]|uniref:DUF2441 domain-containing protein n=1 Tax=Psychrobacter pocilloporae TaxID=1775882 RepID=UPI003C2E1E1B
MPRFYTVDRSNNINQDIVFSLQKNYTDYDIWTVQDIYSERDVITRIDQLYSEGLSEHGIQYLIKYGIVLFQEGTRSPLPITYTQPMIEAIFELIRQSEFPKLPSRMQSMFAWCNLSDAREFNFSLGNKHSIFEVESENAFIADQRLLYLGGSVIGAYEMARKYWSGHRSNNYKLEAVIPLPAVIGNKI